MSISDTDKKLIKALSQGIPVSPRPFRDIAKQTGMEEEDVFRRISLYRGNGLIRRFGAVLNHRKAGRLANAMSVWIVPADKVENAGRLMSSYREITHCYEREAFPPEWPYNLYAMIHGRARAECENIARDISGKTGITEYLMLYSLEELKKTGMVYYD